MLNENHLHSSFNRTHFRIKIFLCLFIGLVFPCFGEGPVLPKHYQITKNDVVLGRFDAPISIVEFSSFTCLHCAQFHQKVFRQLYESYVSTGLVSYVMVPFPQDAIGLRAAQLAYVKGKDFYPRFADLIFSKQKEWLFSKNPMKSLDDLILKEGIRSQDIKATVQNKFCLETMLTNCLKAHKAFGVDKTPTFLINGRILEGYVTFKDMESVIKKELSAMKPETKKESFNGTRS